MIPLTDIAEHTATRGSHAAYGIEGLMSMLDPEESKNQ
jgi:hypothetical protein